MPSTFPTPEELSLWRQGSELLGLETQALMTSVTWLLSATRQFSHHVTPHRVNL